MKLQTIGEIVKDKNHPLMQEVLHNEDTEIGDDLVCIRCGINYQRGVWDFYSLCDDCFVLFDAQKMEGRFSAFLKGEKKKWFESPKEWIENDKKQKTKKRTV